MVVVYFEKDRWGDSDGRTVLQGGVHAFIEVLWATQWRATSLLPQSLCMMTSGENNLCLPTFSAFSV